VRYELNAPGREQFECFDLEGEVGDVGRERKFEEEPRPEMTVRQERFGVSGVNENRAENQAA
jgi:hypothetical protein